MLTDYEIGQPTNQKDITEDHGRIAELYDHFLNTNHLVLKIRFIDGQIQEIQRKHNKRSNQNLFCEFIHRILYGLQYSIWRKN